MKKVFIPAALLMLALTGCASKSHHKTPVAKTTTTVTTQSTTTNVQIDGKKEVAYLCGAGNVKNPLRVMYGLQGQNVVAAQVSYQGALSPVMMRDTSDVNYNTFVSPQGITWKTGLATSETVDKVGAVSLVQPTRQVVNGEEQIVPQIVTQNCNIDDGRTVVAPAKKVKTTKTVTTRKVYKRK
jgi:ABC-type Fe3+-hydroxamate transport system substrate-binding protein